VRTDVTAPAVAEIMKELKRIIDAPVTADELAMGRDALVRSLPSDFETSQSTASSLGNLYVYDLGLDYYARLPGQMAAVTIDAIQAVARKYLAPDQMKVIAVGDKAKIDAAIQKLKLGAVEYRKPDGSLVKK